jgi:acid phosphatase type 7
MRRPHKLAVAAGTLLNSSIWILRGESCGAVVFRWTGAESSITYRHLELSRSDSPELCQGVSISYTLSSYSSPSLWSCAASDLFPGERYSYSFGKESAAFVVPSCRAGGSTTLFAVGDIGVTQHSVAVVGSMLQHVSSMGAAPAAVLLLGDLAYADGIPELWSVFAAVLSPLLSRVPTAILPGNHDFIRNDDIIAYEALFAGHTPPPIVDSNDSCMIASGRARPALSSPGHWGAWRSGSLHVIYLCVYLACSTDGSISARHPQLPLGVEQSAWLLQELACRVDRAVTPFLILALHTPLYHSSASHTNDPMTLAVLAWLEPILQAYGVDAIIGGHEHTLEVTWPAFSGAPVPFCDGGVVHIVVGTGGAYDGGLYDEWVSPRPAWSRLQGAPWYGYATIEVNDNDATLTYWQVPRVGGNGSMVGNATALFRVELQSHALACSDGRSNASGSVTWSFSQSRTTSQSPTSVRPAGSAIWSFSQSPTPLPSPSLPNPSSDMQSHSSTLSPSQSAAADGTTVFVSSCASATLPPSASDSPGSPQVHADWEWRPDAVPSSEVWRWGVMRPSKSMSAPVKRAVELIAWLLSCLCFVVAARRRNSSREERVA